MSFLIGKPVIWLVQCSWLGGVFLKKKDRIFIFVSLTLEIPEQTSFHPLEILRSKTTKTHRNCTWWLFPEHPWKCHFFFKGPLVLEFPHALSSISLLLEIQCLQHSPSPPPPSPTPSTVWIFSGITQYIWTEQPNLQKNNHQVGQHWTVIPLPWKLIDWLVSIINRIVARCLCFRSVTEGFCSPLPKLSKCSHDLLLLPKQQFSNEKNW